MFVLPCDVEVPRETRGEQQAGASWDGGHVDVFLFGLESELEVSCWPSSAGPVAEVDGQRAGRKSCQTNGVRLVLAADEQVSSF